MDRVIKKFQLTNPISFSKKLLQWAQTQQTFLWLDNNNYPQKYSSFDKALALGVLSELSTSHLDAFEKLNQYQQQVNDYIFGYLSYDLKNDTEALNSDNYDGLAFPDLYFFQPKKLFFFYGNTLELQYLKEYKNEIDSDFKLINKTILKKEEKGGEGIKLTQRISEKDYYKKIAKTQAHIQRGDSYEINFCMEYYVENATINPLSIYTNLNKISTPPFATFFKNKQHFLLSASPERFVRKEGEKIISQPIKGTTKRSQDSKEDLILIEKLQNDPKERAENIMIVDLVRNDLSKTAMKNSVQVEELCAVYAFKQVHQMISTVISKVKKEVTPVNLIKSLFPMGSMTGAPKISTMKIIENLEESKRGVYSGAVGYFTPNDDFDFNVVIRSILYNEEKKYISYSVGGAITAKSIPENEYKECLLKADAMKRVLMGK